MEEPFAALEQAFRDYREDVERFERNKKPAEGLFGIGRTLSDDPCHDRVDGRVGEAVAALAAARPAPAEAGRAVRLLLQNTLSGDWPLAAQWMLRALERHCLPLVPFLDREEAGDLAREYAGRYRPYDRLPTQKQLLRALKQAARSERI